MPWGKIDDGFYDHPKLDKLGSLRLPAVGLYWLADSWCNRFLTDGEIPEARIGRLGGNRKLAEALVEAGLFERTPEGYRIHDYLEFNKSRQHVLQERSRWASNKASRRDSTGESTVEPRESLRSVPGAPFRSPIPSPSIPVPPEKSQMKPPTDEQMILSARAVLADRTASEAMKQIARDTLENLGVAA